MLETKSDEVINNEEKLTLTVPEAGRLLGCSRNYAYELARRGEIPVIRLGRKLVVPRDRFLKWLNGDVEGER